MRIILKTTAITIGCMIVFGAGAHAQQADEGSLKDQLDAALEENRALNSDDADDFVGSLVLENTTDEPRPLYPDSAPQPVVETPALPTVPAPTATPATLTAPTETAAPAAPEPKEKSVSFAHDAIVFGFDSSTLKAESNALLQDLATVMSSPDFEGVVFRIEGHTDSHGPEAYNLALSQRRAAAVTDYLVSAGVPSERLTSIGKGESQPLLTGSPGAAANRRVEVIPNDR